VRVLEATFTVGQLQRRTMSVPCSTGYRVVGGAWRVPFGDRALDVFRTQIDPANDIFWVEAYNANTLVTRNITVQASCMRLVDPTKA
jgi:hypothetical protein